MMVEDDLGAMGCATVEAVTTGSAAMDALSKKRIDLAVLVVRLAGDGTSFQVAQRLKMRGIPIIFATGSESEEMSAEFQAVDFVAKAFPPNALWGALLRALHERQAWRVQETDISSRNERISSLG